MIYACDTIVQTINRATQQRLVDQVREVCQASPLVRPRTPNGMAMRVRVTAAGRLGGVGARSYHYSDRDSSGNPWPSMPSEWTEIADEVAGRHPWDSAIINWYDHDASLGWHRDKAEADRSFPIVTISLGDACSWAVRADEDSPISRARLESGDVTLLADDSRDYLHSVERIIPARLFSPLT